MCSVGLIITSTALPIPPSLSRSNGHFRYVQLKWIPREENLEANRLAQIASGYVEQEDDICIDIMQLTTVDWRADHLNYLRDLARGVDKRTRQRALKHVLIGNELHFRMSKGLLLECLGPNEALKVMHDVHEGACGAHQSAHKMRWLIRRSSYYWPTMLEDCFKYYKGCQDCQKFGAIQMAPAGPLNPIIKPWPFRGWGMDMIG